MQINFNDGDILHKECVFCEEVFTGQSPGAPPDLYKIQSLSSACFIQQDEIVRKIIDKKNPPEILINCVILHFHKILFLHIQVPNT